MNTTTITNTHPASNKHIQQDVEDELNWTPSVDSAAIGVSVIDGIVTLSGEVKTFSERLAAKKAALRVRGVDTVADEIKVAVVAASEHSDTEIARSVKHVLEWNADVPRDAVTTEVRDGWVTLTGTVDWDYQREAATRAVAAITGVRFVDNQLTLTRRVSATDAAERIKNAFVRNAQVDAKAITITISGTTATLTGTVRSWNEKSQAATSAWASPHVTAVHNNLKVRAV
jgi:osmotically-inducible protein OsmY